MFFQPVRKLARTNSHTYALFSTCTRGYDRSTLAGKGRGQTDIAGRPTGGIVLPTQMRRQICITTSPKQPLCARRKMQRANRRNRWLQVPEGVHTSCFTSTPRSSETRHLPPTSASWLLEWPGYRSGAPGRGGHGTRPSNHSNATCSVGWGSRAPANRLRMYECAEFSGAP